jgi:hypothetical protein
VTSVLQTTAGKMIFGKFDERMRVAERMEPKAEIVKPEVRKAQPIIVESAPHSQSE